MVYAAAWSPDGTRIASGGEDGTLQVWDAQTGRRLLTSSESPGDQIPALAWSPDGKELAAGIRGSVQVLDTSTSQNLGSFTIGQAADARTVAWSPDGRSLASGANAGSLHVWPA
jgi:eukaryotic-like serine/threonine-protein kinase